MGGYLVLVGAGVGERGAGLLDGERGARELALVHQPRAPRHRAGVRHRHLPHTYTLHYTYNKRNLSIEPQNTYKYKVQKAHCSNTLK